MKGMSINVGEILRQNMMKFRNNMWCQFYYGGLITKFLWSHEIEEELVDMTIERHLELTGKLVVVTRTKALNTLHGPILLAPNRQLRDAASWNTFLGWLSCSCALGAAQSLMMRWRFWQRAIP